MSTSTAEKDGQKAPATLTPLEKAKDIGVKTIWEGLRLLVEYRAIATGEIDRVLDFRTPATYSYVFDAGTVQQYLTHMFLQRLRSSGLSCRGHIAVDGLTIRVCAKAEFDRTQTREGLMIIKTARFARVCLSPVDDDSAGKCARCHASIVGRESNTVRPTCGHSICRICWTSFKNAHANDEVRRLVWYYVRSGHAQSLSPKQLQRILVDNRKVSSLTLQCEKCHCLKVYHDSGDVEVNDSGEVGECERMQPYVFLKIMQLSDKEVLRHAGLIECYSSVCEAFRVNELVHM